MAFVLAGVGISCVETAEHAAVAAFTPGRAARIGVRVARHSAGHRRHLPPARSFAEALIAIKDQPSCTAEWLVGVLRLTQPGVAHVVRKLSDAGWVERHAGADGRSRALRLTPAGEAVAVEILAARNTVLEELVGVLSAVEREHLCAVADRLLRPPARSDQDLAQLCRLCDRSRCTRCPVHAGYLDSSQGTGSG